MRGTARPGPAYRTPAGGKATILGQVPACAGDPVYRPRYRNARDASEVRFDRSWRFWENADNFGARVFPRA